VMGALRQLPAQRSPVKTAPTKEQLQPMVEPEPEPEPPVMGALRLLPSPR
jgi:hypothetical protein